MKQKTLSKQELETMREEMSTRDMAKVLGISVPTVYKLLREANIPIGVQHKIKLVD